MFVAYLNGELWICSNSKEKIKEKYNEKFADLILTDKEYDKQQNKKNKKEAEICIFYRTNCPVKDSVERAHENYNNRKTLSNEKKLDHTIKLRNIAYENCNKDIERMNKKKFKKEPKWVKNKIKTLKIVEVEHI